MLVTLVSILAVAASANLVDAKNATSSQYCPSANDIVAAYGSPNIFNGGWSITGGGAAATKASFNLLGGSVEYDIDLSHANTGVNANIYTISPTGISGWTGFASTRDS